jgi:hypothetical protein
MVQVLVRRRQDCANILGTPTSNIDADDLPAAAKKSFDAMVEAEATFKADLEKLQKNEGHMPEDKFLIMSRKEKRLGVAFELAPFHSPMPPVLPTERIAHLRTAGDCCAAGFRPGL